MLLKCLNLLLLEQRFVQTFKSFSFWAAAPPSALVSLIYLIRSISTRNSCLCLEVSHFCHLDLSSPGAVLPKLLFSSLTRLDAWKGRCYENKFGVKSIAVTFYVQSLSPPISVCLFVRLREVKSNLVTFYDQSLSVAISVCLIVCFSVVRLKEVE